MNLTKAARLLPALFASLQVGVFATPAEAQNDNWVRSCNRSNNLAYCQETDKRRSSGGNTTSSATLGASFAGAMRQSMEAWDTFGKASAGKSLAEFATSDVMAKAQADFLAKQELAKKLSTPEGRRDHYGSLKGTGDARIDYLYAVYADDADGLIWMKKAADAGHANAAYTLAFYHEQ